MGKLQTVITQTFLLFLILLPALSSSTSFLSDNIQLNCLETGRNIFKCNYRLLQAEKVIDIQAEYAGKNINLTHGDTYPASDSVTAVLFLVDTSDPGRESVVQNNRKHIQNILKSTRPHHHIGLARFDKGFKLLVPVGKSKNEIISALDGLHAVGKITELYRSVLSAISVLQNVDADRKSIYLFSDGLAEDKAYYHDDVVKAANEAGVIINSLGYPRSVSLSVNLQTIRRLSEETGGFYIETGNNFVIPDSFITHPFENLDNGGTFNIDLNPLLESGTAVQKPVIIRISTANKIHTIGLALDLDLPAPIPEKIQPNADTETKKAAAPAKTQQEIRVITREIQPEPFDKWFWYGIPAALIFLLIITIVVMLYTMVKQRQKSTSSTGARQTELKPYAYLVLQDESKKRYPITRTTWRIGRGTDNELVLNDSSVSRRHAEIHRSKGDIFTIYDLDSMNGVYINNNKVSKSPVLEGDIIEIGDINLRFTLLSTDYSVEESTIMQNTRAPVTH